MTYDNTGLLIAGSLDDNDRTLHEAYGNILPDKLKASKGMLTEGTVHSSSPHRAKGRAHTRIAAIGVRTRRKPSFSSHADITMQQVDRVSCLSRWHKRSRRTHSPKKPKDKFGTYVGASFILQT